MAEFCEEHCDSIIGTIEELMKRYGLDKEKAMLLRSAWLVSEGECCEECGTAYLSKRHIDGPKGGE